MSKSKPGQSRSKYRQSRLEHLEPRWVMSASPTLAVLGDVTLAAGAPLHIALDAADADGDNLNFSISISNQNITGGDIGYQLPQGNRSMLISTNYGDMVFQLFEQRAPDTTARIIELTESDFYDGLIFHRVISNFMIQGGDPDGNGTGGSGQEFDDEFHPNLLHTSAGVLSMAKSSDDTNDSQFFITAGPTRHLDFNHSIFGFQTEGQDVRQAIEQVAVDGSSKPLTDVVMQSVEIFYDTENGVLMLSAPEGAVGTADVTVTVDDGNGGTVSQTFSVTVGMDTDTSADAPPYLGDISDVTTTADTPVTFNLPATDIEGGAIYYAGLASPANDNISVDVNSSTGQVTVTPSGGITGVYTLIFGVRKTSGGEWDTQAVPLLINPGSPTNVDLMSSGDTGGDDSDDITSLNNTAGQTMMFLVSGTVSGATVSLFADGQLIGQALAGGSTTLIATNGTLSLSDGAHSFTAGQTLQNVDLEVGNRDEQVDLQSDPSASLSVTVDTVAPLFTSTAPTSATAGLLYQYQAAAGSGVVFRLDSGPSGMTVSPSGLVSWTPNSQHAAQESAVLIATDAAGNAASQSFSVQLQQGPDVQPVPGQAVDEGQTVAFTVVATPYDNDGPLTFSLDAGAPAGAIIDADGGQFTWTTNEDDGPGQYTINIRVTAPSGASHVESVLVTVGEVNTAPLLSEIGDVSASEGQLIALTAAATDADRPANQLAYSLVGNVPAGAAIDADSGRFTWRPGESHGGQNYTITVRVADDNGGSGQQSFNIAVAEIDDAPVFGPVDSQMVMTGTTLRLAVVAADPDLPANPLRYSIESGTPAGLAIDPDSGLITWDVPGGYAAGSFDIVVRATEMPAGQAPGLSTTASLQITVVPAASAWLALDRVLGGASKDDGFDNIAARKAADALLLGSAGSTGSTSSTGATSTGAALRFLPMPTSMAASGSEGMFGFELAVSGSGGQPVKVAAEIDGEIDGDKLDSDDIDTNNLDPQAAIVPTMPREELVDTDIDTDLAETAIDANESNAQPQLPPTAQAIDAAITDFDESEETGESQA